MPLARVGSVLERPLLMRMAASSKEACVTHVKDVKTEGKVLFFSRLLKAASILQTVHRSTVAAG